MSAGAGKIWVERAEVFGQTGGAKARHRVSERLSKLNVQGRAFGVRLELAGADRIVLRYAGKRRLKAFHDALARGTGAVQRALAQSLGEQVGIDAGSLDAALKGLVRLQLQELAAATARPLQSALGLSAEALYIDPPYRVSPAPDKGPAAPPAAELLVLSALQSSPFHALVIGEPGGGKSTLLYRVFQELCRAYLADSAKPLPLLIPAVRADALEGRFWSRPELREALIRLETAGRLVLLIDGLDENPDLADCSRREVMAAWGHVARNRCIVSCRRRFYEQNLKSGGFESKVSARWTILSLTEWRPLEAEALYRNLSGCTLAPPPEAKTSATRLKEVFTHLGRLSAAGRESGAASIRKTPLHLWLYSLFVASNRGLFPRNEYELLEFVFAATCRWQAEKKGRPIPLGAWAGMLTRMAWLGYAAGPGRQRRHLRLSALLELVETHWPGLDPRAAEAVAELQAHSLVESDHDSGVVWVDPRFGDFLAARHLIQTAVLQDSAELLRQFSSPVLWDVSHFFDEGLDVLPEADRRAACAGLIAAFKEGASDLSGGAERGRQLALNQIAYHLGRMNDPRGADVLRRALAGRSPALASETCRWAVLIGLALSGDDAPLVEHVDRLQRRPRSARAHLTFCQIYYLDKSPAPGGLDELGPSWERSCAKLLDQLSSREFRGIQILDLFCLRRFLEELGQGPLLGEGAQALRDKLLAVRRRIAADTQASPALKAQHALLERALDAGAA